MDAVKTRYRLVKQKQKVVCTGQLWDLLLWLSGLKGLLFAGRTWRARWLRSWTLRTRAATARDVPENSSVLATSECRRSSGTIPARFTYLVPCTYIDITGCGLGVWPVNPISTVF